MKKNGVSCVIGKDEECNDNEDEIRLVEGYEIVVENREVIVVEG